jgi:hypothetical protein
MEEKPKKYGRPSKYDPKFCDMLIEHMSNGLSFEAFAGLLKVSRDVLYRWTKSHEEFAEAKKVATEACRKWWEQAGIDGLHSKSFSSAVWIYNMKCRFKEDWADVQKVEQTTKMDVTASTHESLINETLKAIADKNGG